MEYGLSGLCITRESTVQDNLTPNECFYRPENRYVICGVSIRCPFHLTTSHDHCPATSSFPTLPYHRFISLLPLSLGECVYIFKVRRLHKNLLTRFEGCGKKRTPYIVNRRVLHMCERLTNFPLRRVLLILQDLQDLVRASMELST